jgi:hypothetical protein
MRRFRLTGALVGIVVAASLVAAAPLTASPSSAGPIRKPPKPIVCLAMSGGESSPTVVSDCNRSGITARSGTLSECPTGTDTCITWAAGKEMDVILSFTVPTKSRCGNPGLVEVDAVGNVVGASGSGTKRLIGARVAYDACLTEQITVNTEGLVPGTAFTIG